MPPQSRRMMEGGVEVSQQGVGVVVGDDLVHEGRVQLRPASLHGAELVAELTGCGGVFPGLPDVGGEFGVDVIGELVAEAFAEGLAGKFLGGQRGCCGCGRERFVVGRGRRLGGRSNGLQCSLTNGKWAWVAKTEAGVGAGGEEEVEAGEEKESRRDGTAEGNHGGSWSRPGAERRGAGMAVEREERVLGGGREVDGGVIWVIWVIWVLWVLWVILGNTVDAKHRLRENRGRPHVNLERGRSLSSSSSSSSNSNSNSNKNALPSPVDHGRMAVG
ncbi:predicted protein [Histoplasma mississippiense (nom. inval.)]|uniref:predicted protein n=1 Tax=Ajellomyces capsulatus (strain NAm1 / WU24) TaxID=2059318 RepID=UPI000157B572|nr:predicted protein [Histoplasma mississippiense (nom. inval.)]EDN02849.1 predicted protein [Histoplasma mississippiense (nom. inval.)]